MFWGCSGLTSVRIPSSVAQWEGTCWMEFGPPGYCEYGNFGDCANLRSVYFEGNAPGTECDPLCGEVVGEFADTPAILYYLPGTTGWAPTLRDRPTALWVLPQPVILGFGESFGVRTNQFGFIVSWATNATVVVEAATDVANPTWSPVSTNTLTDGWVDFTDPDWANYPSRFYRVRSD